MTGLPGGRWRGRALSGALCLLMFAGGCGSGRPGSSAPPPLPHGVRAVPSERTYPVTGTTVEEIGRSLQQNRIAVNGGRWAGLHSWRLRWSFRYASSGGNCRMQSVDVVLNTETTLPRWVDRESADPALAEKWDTYLGRLRSHENGHRDIAYAAARAVQRELRRATSRACGTLRAQANQRAERVLERHRERNRRYDEETGHGRTQGVAWPPASPPEEGGAGPGPTP